MSDEFNKEGVLRRVKKMMALANDAGASEGERDNALRMAHNILTKYNLTMAEAEAHGQKPEEARNGSHIEGRDYPWMRTVAHAVGDLYFCEYFYVSLPGGTVKHFFVGRESNVYTAQEMTKYVISSINREGKKNDPRGGTYWRSFCKGAAYQVYQRCAKLRKDAESQPKTPGTALVLASVYQIEAKANADWIAQQIGELKSKKTKQRNTNASAFMSGRVFGDKVNLNRQIGSTTPTKQIKG